MAAKWHKMLGWCESVVVSVPSSLVGFLGFYPYMRLFSSRQLFCDFMYRMQSPMSSHCLSFLALVSAFLFKFPAWQLLFSDIHTLHLPLPSSLQHTHTHKQPSSNKSMKLPIVVMTPQDWRPSTTSWRRRQTSTTTSSARAWINSLDLDHPSKG